jgi:hypothetical protein
MFPRFVIVIIKITKWTFLNVKIMIPLLCLEKNINTTEHMGLLPVVFGDTITNRGNMEKGKKKMDSYWSKKGKSNDPIQNKDVGVCLLVRISTQLRTLT